MMIKLKPCPFCGGNNLGISNKVTTISFKRKRHVAVYCKNCNAYGARIVADETNYPEFCSGKSKMRAIELWNNRVVKNIKDEK
jgi:Lar family restriction alleviation protein